MSLAAAILAAVISGAPAPSPPPSAPPPSAAPAATSPQTLEPDATPLTGDQAPADPLADSDNALTVQSAYQAAEQRQGPLDGRCRLSDGAGEPLYDFLLTDPGAAASARASDPDHPQIEGAWRDLRSHGAAGGLGVIDSVRRDGPQLQIQFQEPDQKDPRRITLHAATGGDWNGELIEGGKSRKVVLGRL